MVFLEGVSMQEYLDYRFPIPCEGQDCLAAHAFRRICWRLHREGYDDNSAGQRAKVVCGFSNQLPSRRKLDDSQQFNKPNKQRWANALGCVIPCVSGERLSN